MCAARDLPALWREARGSASRRRTSASHQHHQLPGGDYCALANAKSIPVAQAIQERFDDLDYLHEIGELDLNISGCINACGHHHVGHIGILGVDKNGEEWYQVEIGGLGSPPSERSSGPRSRGRKCPTCRAADRLLPRTATAKPSASSTWCIASASNLSRNTFMATLIKGGAS